MLASPRNDVGTLTVNRRDFIQQPPVHSTQLQRLPVSLCTLPDIRTRNAT
jgi:hypothetical protein